MYTQSQQYLRRVGFAMLAMTIAACADRTPSGIEPVELQDPLSLKAAASLEQSALDANSTGDTDAAVAFNEAALALRLGVRPSEISVAVDGEVGRYQAVVVAFVETLSPGDTALRRSVIAWQGDNRPLALLDVSTMGDVGSFSSEFEPASDPRSRAQGLWVNFVRDARYVATTGTASISIGALGEPCRAADSRHNHIRCTYADFNVGVDGLFRLWGSSPRAGLDAVRIFVDASRVNGVIIGDGQSDRPPHRRPPTTTTGRRQQQETRGR